MKFVNKDLLPIRNPFNSAYENFSKISSVKQLEDTYSQVEEIILNLDDLALKELSAGMTNDLDAFIDETAETAFSVLYGDGAIIKATSHNHNQVLSNSIEETLRVSNLNYFISSVLTDFDVNWHHLEWGALAQEYDKLCIIAPRDHGKSYFWSHAYPIWKMYKYAGNRQRMGRTINDVTNHRGFLITNEMSLAEDLLEIIKGTIEENDILREKLFNENRDNWAKTSIRCKNGARMNIKSYGGTFRGRHPGWIVVDDFLKDSSIYSDNQRTKSINYFHSVIMNAIIPGGQVAVVGTPFHQGDLYGNLKKKRGPKGWRVFEYPALMPDGRILWAGRYDYEAIMAKREAQGNIIFSREILCRPIVSDSSIFPWKILKRSLLGMDQYTLVKNIDSFPKKFSKVVTACDLALSAAVGADYSVFTTWGIDYSAGEMWLLHLWRGKGKSYQEQINIVRSIHRNFNSNVIVIESNQFQRMFADMAKDEFNLPVVPHTTTAGNKNDLANGLPSMALMFERGKIKIPYGDQHSKDVANLILNEFSEVSWTEKGIEGVGEHDDCAMSTWLGKRGMFYDGNSGRWIVDHF